MIQSVINGYALLHFEAKALRQEVKASVANFYVWGKLYEPIVDMSTKLFLIFPLKRAFLE